VLASQRAKHLSRKKGRNQELFPFALKFHLSLSNSLKVG